LRLLDDTFPNAYLLRHINVPVGALIRIFCTDIESDSNDFSSICLALEESNGGYREKTIQHLTVDMFAADSVQIVGRCILVPDDAPADLDILLSVPMRQQGNTIAATVSILHNLYLQRLRVLHFHDIGLVGQSTWLQTFTCSQDLKVLLVRGQALYGLIGALMANTKSCDSKETTIFLPRLRKLVIEAADVTGATFNRLKESMEIRDRQGNRVEELHIRQCSNFTDGHIEILTDVVPVVDWDGTSGAWTSDEEDDESYTSEDIGSTYGTEYDSIDEFDYQDA
jgi:hypothetical protein